MMDAGTCWMLVACILAAALCLVLMHWIEYKRGVAAGEFEQPSLWQYPNNNNAWRSDRKRCSVQDRRRDIESNLQVGEWLPEDSDTDEALTEPIEIKVLADTMASTSLVDDPMERLRETSRLVSSSSHGVSSDECAICLTTLRVHDMVCQANHVDCVHVFHADCMKRWLLHQDSCPICRTPYL